MDLIKKHFDRIVQALGLLLLCALVAALIAAFRGDMLPFASDGDAFDTIYAVAESDASVAGELSE